MDQVNSFSKQHEQLKRRIHSFRLPLSQRGRAAAAIFYFCLGPIAGYGIYQCHVRPYMARTEERLRLDRETKTKIQEYRDMHKKGGLPTVTGEQQTIRASEKFNYAKRQRLQRLLDSVNPNK